MVHCITQRHWPVQHDLLLHLRLQATQVSHEDILIRHDVPNLKDQSSEFLIVLLHRATLTEVKQFGLMTQLMMHILELSSNTRSEVRPSAVTEHSPLFSTDSTPPSQSPS